MKALRIIIVNLFRVAIALTFILSGFVKAVDPKGTQYKIEDYLEALGYAGALPDLATLMTSVALSGTEFILGVLMLFAVRRKWVSRYILLFMLVMTGISAWLWIADPISDCGCFGDAVHLTNLQTFLKNIGLLTMSIVVTIWPKDMIRFVSHSNMGIVFNYSLLFIIGVCSYSLYLLPPFDFRPYHIGANIKEGMEIPEGETGPKFVNTFIMKKDGVTKEFTLENYPDSTWEFVDTKTVKVADGYEPPIHDFSIENDEEGDITEDILNDSSYTFLLVSPHLETAEDTYFGTFDRMYEYCQENGYRFYCLTASGEEAIDHWKDTTGATYPFCLTDEITLKTIVRSNPGLVLLKNGTVINKWSHNNLPYKELTKPLDKLEIGQLVKPDQRKKIVYLLLLFFIPLAAFSLLDRVYTGLKWLVGKYADHRKKNKEKKEMSKVEDKEDKSSNISLFKNKTNMRKKIVAGNWKMNKNLQEGIELATELNEALAAEKPNCDVVICTPFIHLAKVSDIINHDVINLGAENCADKASGAYTGEVSAEMVKSTGCEYVILGHSERREYYHETPEILKEKVDLALANGLKILFCIGESLEQREANEQEAVCRAELEGSVFHLTAEQFANVVIAYEPIWAIGTGKTATSDQAEEIHAYIRSVVAEKYGAEVAENTSILYGGSCKASNAPELFAKPDIDGGLIGGASLKCADFKGIIDAWK